MDNQKRKGHNVVPNVRLAQVFNFTSEDLAANRLGFLTREQKWHIPIIIRPLIHSAFAFLPSRQRDKVSHMCGKLNIKKFRFVRENKNGYLEMRYVAWLRGYTLQFNISEEQYEALAPYVGKLHHIYYIFRLDQNSRIVAIEVAEYGC